MKYKHVPRIHLSIDDYQADDVKNLSNLTFAQKNARRWFQSMLWRAFPSQSECQLAKTAAPVLHVSERQVRNWLREENDASLSHVIAVMAVAGVELVLKKVEAKE